MLPTITAFAASPDRGRGLARDRPVRWAFEEVGQPYQVAWMFAAVSTVEPVIVQRESTIFLERDKDWFAQRMALVEGQIRNRLRGLSARLADSGWLDGPFSAGDLLMVQVLRRLGGSELLAEHPNLAAYVMRAEARPAFKRASAAQLAVFTAQAPSAKQ